LHAQNEKPAEGTNPSQPAKKERISHPIYNWEIGFAYTPGFSINYYNSTFSEGIRFAKSNTRYMRGVYGAGFRVTVARKIIRFLYVYSGLEYQTMGFNFERPEDQYRSAFIDRSGLTVRQTSQFLTIPLGLEFRFRPSRFVVVYLAPEIAGAFQLRTTRYLRNIVSPSADPGVNSTVTDQYKTVTGLAQLAFGVHLRPLKRHRINLGIVLQYQFTAFQKSYQIVEYVQLKENYIFLGARVGYAFSWGKGL
jgi:hypothetical protein